MEIIDFYFFITFFCLLILIFNVLINILWGPYLKKIKINLQSYPKVSILIPARNEENNIKKVIESSLKQNYPRFEVIVLDDNSTDKTYEIAKCYEAINSNFKIIKGDKLPDGWLGKNWACYQLANNASGEILIFTDADNFFENDAVIKTVSIINQYDLDMFSVFPQQITATFWEKLIIPIIDLIIYSGLILKTSYYVPFSLFAAANGQWIAFKKSSYEELGGHSSVKNQIVEDVALARFFKKNKKKILVGAGTGVIYGKMYDNFKQIWSGLSKNLFGLTDFKTIPFFIILILMLLVCVVPYFLLFTLTNYFILILFIIILNIIWRVLLAINFKHNILYSTLLHPISILLITIIGINSFLKSKFGVLSWKEREIILKK
jgi:chlorobactene glucosyltransferase